MRLAGWLPCFPQAPGRRCSRRGTDVGRRREFLQLLGCQLGDVGAVADFVIRHTAFDPGERSDCVAVEGWLWASVIGRGRAVLCRRTTHCEVSGRRPRALARWRSGY
jgi:hypothetical protein